MIRQHTSVRIPKVFVSPGLYLTGAQMFQTLFLIVPTTYLRGSVFSGSVFLRSHQETKRIRDDIFGYGSIFYI